MVFIGAQCSSMYPGTEIHGRFFTPMKKGGGVLRDRQGGGSYCTTSGTSSMILRVVLL